MPAEKLTNASGPTNATSGAPNNPGEPVFDPSTVFNSVSAGINGITNDIGIVATALGNTGSELISTISTFAGIGTSGGILGKGVRSLDDAVSRLLGAKLLPGGKRAQKKIGAISGSSDTRSVVATDQDWRLRVSVAPTSGVLYESADAGLMTPLQSTSGVIFPYTPSIQMTHSNAYTAQSPTHSNYPIQSYQHSEIGAITISGEFSVQSQTEGEYLLAVIHFFRGATKMFYGSDTLAGNPPPILFLNGYGESYLPNVPCVITSFSHDMPEDVDYMDIAVGAQAQQGSQTSPYTQSSGTVMFSSPPVTSATATLASVSNLAAANVKSVPLAASVQSMPTNNQSTAKANSSPSASAALSKTRLPTLSKVTITLIPVYSRKHMFNDYSTDKLASGGFLIGNKGGFI